MTIRSYKNPDLQILRYWKNELYGFSQRRGIFKFNGRDYENILQCNFEGNGFSVILTPNKDALIINSQKNLYHYKDDLKIIKIDLTLIRDIMFDQEGNLWVATEEGLYNFFRLNFVNYKFGRGSKDWVWTILEDSKKNMWFTSFQNGIWKWDGKQIYDYSDRLYQQQKRQYNSPHKHSFFMGGSKFNNLLYFPTSYNIVKYNGSKFSQVNEIISEVNQAYFVTKTDIDSIFYCGRMPGLFRVLKDGTTTHWPKDV